MCNFPSVIYFYLNVLIISGGNIAELLAARGKPLNPYIVTSIFYQMCSATRHMHCQSPPLIHRDLKVSVFCCYN